MYKCKNCGTKFDGKFCPECGTRAVEINCPQCGTPKKDGAKFCIECGYSFVSSQPTVQSEQPNVQSEEPSVQSEQAVTQPKKSAVRPQPQKTKQPAKTAEDKKKLYNLMLITPAIILALFAVLLYSFFAATAVKLGLLGLMEGESLYAALGDESQSKLHASMWMLIVFAILAVALTVIMFISAVMPKIRLREDIRTYRSFSDLLALCAGAVYLGVISVASALIGTINKMGDGLIEVKTGAGPILILVFAIIFLGLTVGALIYKNLLKKDVFSLLVSDKERYFVNKFANERAKKEKYYATHSEPIPPVEGEKHYEKKKLIYKHAKRRYDKAKEGHTPGIVIWIEMHKTFAIILGISVLTILMLFVILTIVSAIDEKRTTEAENGYYLRTIIEEVQSSENEISTQTCEHNKIEVVKGEGITYELYDL